MNRRFVNRRAVPRRAGVAVALLAFAALLSIGVATAASADDGSVSITVTVPEGESPSPSPTPGPSGNLPRTGPAIAGIVGVAATLIVVGAGLVALGRRSRKTHLPPAALRPSRKDLSL